MAANQLTEFLRGRKYKGFSSCPFYCKEGDFVTYYFSEEDCHAERIDDLLTVYRSMARGEFVGFKLKGVKHLVSTLGDFALRVDRPDGKPMLGMLFMAGGFLYGEGESIGHYRRLFKETQEVPLPDEALQPA